VPRLRLAGGEELRRPAMAPSRQIATVRVEMSQPNKLMWDEFRCHSIVTGTFEPDRRQGCPT